MALGEGNCEICEQRCVIWALGEGNCEICEQQWSMASNCNLPNKSFRKNTGKKRQTEINQALAFRIVKLWLQAKYLYIPND